MEMEHYSYTVDFTDLKNWRKIYPLIKKSMDFPDYFGENLSALWDCLTDYTCSQNTITIKGVKSLSQSLQQDIEEILAIFERAQTRYPEYFKIRYED